MVGSGNCCPHDLRFFAGLECTTTGGGVACVDMLSSKGYGAGDELCRSSSLRNVGGSDEFIVSREVTGERY